MSNLPNLKIRLRSRRGRPPEAQGDYMVWEEYQVVDGRRVIGRFDLEEQAQRFIDEKRAAGEAA